MDAILLLAGNSHRFGDNKLLFPIDGKPMYRHIFEKIIELNLENIVVVTQYREIIQDMQSESVIVVTNPSPEKGQSHSISLGLQALLERNPGSTSCLFSVGDQPFLTACTLHKLISLHLETPKCITLCGNETRRGNPVIFPSKYYPELLELQGDVGGKQVIINHSEYLDILLTPEKELEDIDFKVL
ncbi:MAG: nucleotidyltransferase family protein [Eubacteriales bacterium]